MIKRGYERKNHVKFLWNGIYRGLEISVGYRWVFLGHTKRSYKERGW